MLRRVVLPTRGLPLASASSLVLGADAITRAFSSVARASRSTPPATAPAAARTFSLSAPAPIGSYRGVLAGAGASTAAEAAGEATAASSSDSTVVPSGPQLSFVAESINMAHPEKLSEGKTGEDALFVSPFAIGVADGVGGWAETGVNAGLYASELMERTKKHAMASAVPVDPLEVVRKAYEETRAVGTSTACIASADKGAVRVLNIGDSGALMVRLGQGNLQATEYHQAKWGVVFRSEEQTHFFNCPVQIGTDSTDTPDKGKMTVVPAFPGDLVILSTDGLLDNLFLHDVINIISRVDFIPCIEHVHRCVKVAHSATDLPFTGAEFLASERACRSRLQTLASSLAVRAQVIGADPKAKSPFSASALKKGYWFEGGKLDDVTVVVGLVVPAPLTPK